MYRSVSVTELLCCACVHLMFVVVGCGKSSLIRNLCGVLGAPLHILNIHGGMEDKDIIDWMNKRIKTAKRTRSRVIVFLDEINTCNCTVYILNMNMVS